MKTLYLPLKKEWYEMIEAGIKKEEYREESPYWRRRLINATRPSIGVTCEDLRSFIQKLSDDEKE